MRYIPLVLFFALAAFAAFQLFSDRDPNQWHSVLINRQAPPLVALPFETVSSGTGDADVQDFLSNRTQPVVVNFFASYCLPCILEQPQLLALQERGVDIIGVNWKDRPENARAYLQKYGNPFRTIAVDPEARIGIDWGVTGIPETFIVDTVGQVRFHHSGEIDADELHSIILPVLESLQ